MKIPVLYEPNFESDSIWCSQIRYDIEKTLSQRKYGIIRIDEERYQELDYDELLGNTPRLLLLIASSPSWIRPAVRFFNEQNINVILIDCLPDDNTAIIGQVSFHYADAIHKLLAHLSDCGCSRTALYGIFGNSCADHMKRIAFEEEMLERGIEHPTNLCFENKAGLVACYEDFYARVNEFDSVICVNDIAAISLLKRISAEGVRVPEDLQIVSIGSATKLAEMCKPSITGLIFDNASIGQHAVLAYKYLLASEYPASMNLRISGDLIVRESTRPLPKEQRPASKSTDHVYFKQPQGNGQAPSFYNDDEVRVFSRFEKLLLACDPIDLRLLRRLIKSASYEHIADELHLARGTVFYRIRRIEETLGMHSRDELQEFLLSHQFDDVIRK